jgi:hypothetical protein
MGTQLCHVLLDPNTTHRDVFTYVVYLYVLCHVWHVCRPLLHALVYAAVVCCAGAPIYGNELTFDVDLVCFLLFLSFYKYFSLLIIFNYCMYFKNQGLRFV